MQIWYVNAQSDRPLLSFQGALRHNEVGAAALPRVCTRHVPLQFEACGEGSTTDIARAYSKRSVEHGRYYLVWRTG